MPVDKLYKPPKPKMQACSLKFCTAMERPAPIRLCPRCCSKAFIGTTKKPPKAPSKIRKGAATHTLLIKFSKITSKPIATPNGKTKVACSKRIRIDATTAPIAVPTATTPTSAEACVTE